LLERRNRRRTRVLLTVMGIIALHVFPITALLLMQGCKRDEHKDLASAEATNNFLSPLATNEFYTNYPPQATNAATQALQPPGPAPSTNP